MELEELAESELLREVELRGNLLDALIGLSQQELCVINSNGGDPFGRGLAGVLLYDAGEMAGGEVRLRGIVTDASLRLVMLIQKEEKLEGDHCVRISRYWVHNILTAQVEKHKFQHHLLFQQLGHQSHHVLLVGIA